ncbi:MAG: DUF63 family protein [Candidatus Micrarchaeia archaeon]
MGFIEDYFVRPIVEYEGYNPVNTTVYAVIALAAAYGIYVLFTRKGIRFDERFISNILPYILLGSTVRVITDSIDSHVMHKYLSGGVGWLYELIISSHLYDRTFITVSPGIYVIIGLFTVITMYLAYAIGKDREMSKLVSVLWLAHLLVLVPMVVNLQYAIMIIAIAAGITILYTQIKGKSSVAFWWLIVFSQALDGSATFVTLDIYNEVCGGCYAEQHVLANAISDYFGKSWLPFLVLKVILAVLAVEILENEKNANEKNYICLLIVIFGLAPGVRDLLRLAVGA